MKKLLYLFTFIAVVHAASAQNFSRDSMPKPGPTPKVNVAQPKTFKMANGLTVLVVENNKLPKASANLTIDRPPVLEGKRSGYISLMGDMLGEGTTVRSKDDFNKRIDFLGANVSYSSAGAYAQSLSKYFPEIIALMAEGALHPKFTQEELSKIKDRTVENLKSQEKSADAISARVRAAITYGKNSARGEFETIESIKGITLTDIEEAYKNFYTPDNAYLVIVGDVKYNDIKTLVEKHFAGWKKANFMYAPLEKAVIPAATQVNVVDVPNAVQSIINVGNVTDLKMNDPRYFAAIASNYILGGSSDARLFMNLREKNGYTYGAYSRLSTGKYSPNFNADASVRTAVTKGAIKEFLNEIGNVSSITPRELSNAKEKLKGSFIMSLERPETIAQFALNQYTQNLPKDFYTNYLQSIDALNIAGVQEVSKAYITPDKLNIFVTGKAADFADSVESLGYTVKYYDAYANPIAKPLAKKADASVTLASVGEKYIQAIGGKAAAEEIKSVKTIAEAEIQGVKLGMELLEMLGGAYAMSLKQNGNEVMKMVFDGTKGSLQSQGKTMPMEAEMAKTLSENKAIFPELDFAAPGVYTLNGVENVNGEEVYVVKSPSKTMYYSTKTGLKTGERTKQIQQGKEVETTIFLSDYKEVNGVKMPFTLVQNIMGMDIPFKVSAYEFNKLTAADFK